MQPSENTSGQVSITLSERLENRSHMRSKCCIFRVHNHLREHNSKAYEPEIISIGPYHHKKENVLMMEDHKLCYLQLLLQKKNENLERYRDAIRPLEEEVRDSYAESISLSADQLIDMMVLDGCFIIELVRKYNMSFLRDKDDAIFKVNWIIISLQRDLMLFENQVPFSVLRHLFGMIEAPNEKRLIHLLMTFFCDLLPDRKHRWNSTDHSNGNVKHLLDLIHVYWSPSLPTVKSKEDLKNEVGNYFQDRDSKDDRSFIRCATELREAGIQFERKEAICLFDISFKQGRLHIPSFIIEDRTESFLRNLIAHEQYYETNGHVYVTEYVKFLDCLIDSSKDVETLCRYEIIDNWLGDSEAVSRIFNKITDSVIILPSYVQYAKIFRGVNDHCNKPWNRRIAKLRHNYLNSPWGVISILAATILLVLTLTQTIFSVFPR